jgi:hypothetical protein
MQASSAKASVGAPPMQSASASASVLVMGLISRIRPSVAAGETLPCAERLTRGAPRACFWRRTTRLSKIAVRRNAATRSEGTREQR